MLTATAIAVCASAPLGAQRIATLEAGVFGQFTKYDNFTKLDNGVGLGARLGVIFCQRVELEYSAEFTPTKSTRVGNLSALNHRLDAIWNQPVDDHWDFLIGGGFTGSSYQTDTTHNHYDSGGNALLGFRYRMNDDWWWRGDALMDFKDPSDQTPEGQRTETLGLRFGISRLWGGIRHAPNPCSHAPPPPPPPPPAVAPRPA
ncbi:MAG: outer membrane beta-barrel protein, partial [Gemmatimonadales bacterium]